MNPIDPEFLALGKSYPQYRESIERNAETFDEVYEHPAFTSADLELLRRLPPLTVVAIGEDWCPDVYHTLPTWARVAAALDGWSLRVFERDRYPQLMDCRGNPGAPPRLLPSGLIEISEGGRRCRERASSMPSRSGSWGL